MRLPKITSALRTVLYHCSAWGKVQWYTSFLGSWQVWQCQACRSYALYTTQHCIFSPHHLSDAFFSFTLSVDFRRRSSGRDFRNPLSPLSYEKKSLFMRLKEEGRSFGACSQEDQGANTQGGVTPPNPWLKGNFTAAKTLAWNVRNMCKGLQIWHQNFWVRALFSDGAYLIKCASLPSIHWNSSPFSLVCEWGILHIHGDHSGDSLEFA